MKQCPMCNRTYTDETLIYCLSDGSVLSSPYDPQATQQMPLPRVTDNPGQATLPLNSSQAQTLQQGSSRRVVYTLIALLSVLIGIGVVAVLKLVDKGYRPQDASASPAAQTPANLSQQDASRKNENKQDTAPLFEDEFSNTALGSEWQVVSGDWYVKDGYLNGVSNKKSSYGGPIWAAVTLNRELPDNYSVSFRTRIISGEVSELMIHTSNNRYVRAYLYSIDQAVMLGNGTFLRKERPGVAGLEENLENLGGGETVAQRGFPITNNTWYSVKVTAKDNTYTISVGGQLLVKYVDAKGILSKEGTIGLISNGHMQFDDIRIYRSDNQ